MSEQKLSYMQQLDAWTDQAVFALLEADGFVPGAETALQIRKAVRAKVLESYKNGMKARTGHVRKEFRDTTAAGQSIAARGQR